MRCQSILQVTLAQEHLIVSAIKTRFCEPNYSLEQKLDSNNDKILKVEVQECNDEAAGEWLRNLLLDVFNLSQDHVSYEWSDKKTTLVAWAGSSEALEKM